MFCRGIDRDQRYKTGSPFPPSAFQKILFKKISNLYFHTFLWCLKRFYEGLKDLHKTFCGTTKKCENKNLSKFFPIVRIKTGRVNVTFECSNQSRKILKVRNSLLTAAGLENLYCSIFKQKIFPSLNTSRPVHF